MHTVAGTTFGTGLVIDGVTLNSGNRFPGTGTGAGRRIVGPADPTLIARDGKPFMTIGSPGLTTRAVTMALINYLYYGKSLQESVDAPRFDGSDPSRPTAIEARVDDRTREELATRYGLQVRTTTPYNWHMGSVHAIVREADGTLTGVADPRRTGLAAGYE
jgi:gamma-glutamyltranspeptidase/glutathione hydrolase